MMRIGLLECDHIADRYRPIAGDYRDMFERLLVEPDGGVELVSYDACHGVLPPSPDACDAWVCTGSRASVYEELGWIEELSAFVREVRDAGTPFVGVCFGHQLLAHALGGRTQRAKTGWGAGAHHHDVVRVEPWMNPPVEAPNLLFMHQDQVIRLPEAGVVLASTAHCPVAMMRVGETMIGMQAHPEFAAPFVDALLADREAYVGEDETAAARRSLAEPTDERTVARWIAAFIRQVIETGGQPSASLAPVTTTTEQLQAARTKIDAARDAVRGDQGASPVLVAVVDEFARKAEKATGSADERVAVIELEQAGDSAKAAAEADPGVSPAARDAVLDAHLAICIAKGKL